MLPKKKQKMRPETAKVGRSLADKRSNLNVQADKGRSKQASSNAKHANSSPGFSLGTRSFRYSKDE